MAELPRSVHLIAKTPHPDVIRFGRAIRDSQIAERCAGGMVRVLQQVQYLGDAPRSEVHGHHQLGAGEPAPTPELVDADLIRFSAGMWSLKTRKTPVAQGFYGFSGFGFGLR